MRDVKIRIKEARREAKLSQEALALAIGVTRGAVGNWESLRSDDVPSLTNLQAVAKACRTTMAWLVGGASDDLLPPPTLSVLPVLPWSAISKSGVDMTGTDATTERFPCPIPCSPESFILRVNTRAMTGSNPFEESYPEGRLIYCDPNVTPRQSPSRVPVVAWLPERGESVFRMCVTDGGHSWLQGLHPDYPRSDEPFDVRAIVVGLFSSPLLNS